jgi:Na+/phosphate symporter
MKEKFSNEYPKFQAKIANFVLSQNFAARCEEYDELFNQMSSIAPDDMRVYAQKSPAFLDARNKSLSIMEQIVSIHRDLKNLFELNEDALGIAYNYDLEAVDKHIAEKLKQSAYLLHQYALVSEAGRKAIEIADNPFLAQAL